MAARQCSSGIRFRISAETLWTSVSDVSSRTFLTIEPSLNSSMSLPLVRRVDNLNVLVPFEVLARERLAGDGVDHLVSGDHEDLIQLAILHQGPVRVVDPGHLQPADHPSLDVDLALLLPVLEVKELLGLS